MSKRFTPFLATNIEITDTGTDGRGVGRHNNQVVFVDHAVPGDVLDVMVHSREKKFLLGRIEKIVQPSEWRVQPQCKHYGFCGGCKWQSLDYNRQLFYKQKQVTDALVRIGHLEIEQTHPIQPAAAPLHYRNKVEFTFSNRRWLPYEQHAVATEEEKNNALGFHVARHFDKVLHISECWLHEPRINAIRNALHQFAREQQYTFYDIRAQKGFLRNVVFRTSAATGELMVNLIVGEDNPAEIRRILEFLTAQFPEITTLLWMLNTKQNPSYGDLQAHAHKGNPWFIEQLGKWKFRISANAFFQTNTKQAEALYSVVREFMGEEKVKVAWDLYCGAGSIGIFVSDLAEKIVGVEYVQAAVEDAKANAALNGLNHLHFYAGDMKHLLNESLAEQHGRPDLIITDPPRAGMDTKVVEKLLEVGAPKVIYVSCNPATQARDLALMAEQYRVVRVQPVDMFPQTAHVENVALLIKKTDWVVTAKGSEIQPSL